MDGYQQHVNETLQSLSTHYKSDSLTDRQRNELENNRQTDTLSDGWKRPIKIAGGPFLRFFYFKRRMYSTFHIMV